MSAGLFFVCVILLASYAGWKIGTAKALGIRQNGGRLASLPGYYGLYIFWWCALPMIGVLILWTLGSNIFLDQMIQNYLPTDWAVQKPEQIPFAISDIQAMANGQTPARVTDSWIATAAQQFKYYRNLSYAGLTLALLAMAAVFGLGALRRVRAELPARIFADRIAVFLLWLTAALAVLITFGIVLSLAYESLEFFKRMNATEFLFGTHWNPQISIRADQIGGSGAYGAIPIFTGTLLITAIALFLAVPLGLFSAIYLCEYAKPQTRAIIKPILEILAGIPTVVYGFFAALLIGPGISHVGDYFGFGIDSESALAAGLVVGVMLIPFISSLSDDVLHAVPTSLHSASLALGATKSETVRRVILPAALPGIAGACLLAFSRAIGETMIVVMAAGLAANLTLNPLSSVTTVTVQIVALLTGDQEFASTTTLAAFALGLALFFITLILNFIALQIVRRYREQYE